jgi:leucyl-tRNA synthetase
MHADLITYWIRVASLLVTPIAPHFAEHIWSSILKNPRSIQLALWPTPSKPVDRTLIEAGTYMRETIKTIRDAEVSLLKMMGKIKGKKAPTESMFDPKKPKAVRIYVATTFPEWQNTCVQVIKDSYDETANKVDDAKVKQLLTENGLIKDKRVMPFIQAFKVRTYFSLNTGLTAFRFAETNVAIWRPDSLPPCPALLRERRSDRDPAVSEEVFEPCRC